VHDGVVAGTAFAALPPERAQTIDFVRSLSSTRPAVAPTANNIEALFNLSYTMLDGRFANLAWLQELPDPITKMTWDNAVLISPRLAKELGVKSRVKARIYEADVVKVTLGKNSIEIPAFVMPGLADYSVVLNFGYGRTHAGTVGSGVGVNVAALAPENGALYASGVVIEKLPKKGEHWNHARTVCDEWRCSG